MWCARPARQTFRGGVIARRAYSAVGRAAESSYTAVKATSNPATPSSARVERQPKAKAKAKVETKPLDSSLSPNLAYPHLYSIPITGQAHPITDDPKHPLTAKDWQAPIFPFRAERLPRLPALTDPEIRARVFTHFNAALFARHGSPGDRLAARWMGSYKRYEGLGDLVLGYAAGVVVERERPAGLNSATLVCNNTLSHLGRAYRLHHELRFAQPKGPGSWWGDKAGGRTGAVQPGQKVFADLFEAYIGAMYVEADRTNTQSTVFDFLSDLFNPANWPLWPRTKSPVGSGLGIAPHVDRTALYEMLRGVIANPQSRGASIESLPWRGADGKLRIGRMGLAGRMDERVDGKRVWLKVEGGAAMGQVPRLEKGSIGVGRGRRRGNLRRITAAARALAYSRMLASERRAEREKGESGEMAGPEMAMGTEMGKGQDVACSRSATGRVAVGGRQTSGVNKSRKSLAVRPVLVRAGRPALPRDVKKRLRRSIG